MASDLFSKIDTDGSGSVSGTELQSMLDQMASASGSSGTSSTTGADLLKKLDTDGDGSVSGDEFKSALQNSMPPPPPDGGPMGMGPMSTQNFAQMCGSASQTGQGQDPLMSLDTDSDGKVSSSEFGLSSTSDKSLKSFFDAVDGDGDGSITSSEASAFKQKMDALFESARQSTSTDTSSSSSTSSFDNFQLSMLNALVSQQYSTSAYQTSNSLLTAEA